MNTVVETSTFSAKASKSWTTDQYENFILYISKNPTSGKVVSGSGGVRKIRWGKDGAGKRGGTRIIYCNNANNETWLLTMYAKNERENIPPRDLRKIKEAIDA